MKKSRSKRRVGVFDSGIGGLSVLLSCMERTQNVTYYYIGDNVHAPYGNRPKEEIFRLTENAIEKLMRRKADVIVLACNTVTAVCIDRLRKKYPVPFVGVEPAVRSASKISPNVLVLGTFRTMESERIKKLLEKFPDVKITVRPLPTLAGFIERGEVGDLSNVLPHGDFGAVVLGCTHYSLIREKIADFYRVPVLDGNDGVAKRLQNLLGDPFRPPKDTLRDHFCPQGNRKRHNKSKNGKNRVKMGQNKLFFIGNSAFYNKKQYEQMFIFR